MMNHTNLERLEARRSWRALLCRTPLLVTAIAALAASASHEGLAAPVPPTGSSAAEVACAREIAGPSARACTVESCRDPLAVARNGPCATFCKTLHWKPADTQIARDDCRFKQAWRRWAPGNEEVVGGTSALENEYTSTAVIARSLRSTSKLCSGVLIADSIVLTAKHCFEEAGVAVPGAYVHFGRSLTGASEATTPRVERVEPAEVFDLALLKLDRKPAAVRATVASETMIDAAGFVRVVGFGLTEKLKAGDKTWADVLVLAHKCTQNDVRAYGCIPKLELVAADMSKDTCRGDSGGPALVATADIAKLLQPAQRSARYREDMAAGAYFVAAITSYSVGGSSIPARSLTFEGVSVKCGSGGRYVRLAGPALEWIRNSVKTLHEAILVAP